MSEGRTAVRRELTGDVTRLEPEALRQVRDDEQNDDEQESTDSR